MLNKICLVSLSVVMLAACASKPSYFPRTLSSETEVTAQLVSLPPAGQESEVELGKSMVSSIKKYVAPAISLNQDVVHVGKYSDSYQYVLTVPAGILIESGKDTGGTFYEAEKSVTYKYRHNRNNTDSDPELLRGGVYVPKDFAKPTEVFWYWDGMPQNDVHPGIVFKSTTSEATGKDGFKRELVYSGVAQNTVAILYREFVEDMAKPAFYQELRYDLSQGNVIGYKGARFQVIKAGNTSIRYKVLQHLDPSAD